MNTSVQAKLRATLEQNSDVLAAYLFGEDISMYFLLNEPVLQRAEILKKESLEAFCGA